MAKLLLLVCTVGTLLSGSSLPHPSQTQKPNEWAMNNAFIGPDSPIEVPVGGSYRAQVLYPVPDGPDFPLQADVLWWIEPSVPGIFIEAKSGVISVAGSVTPGTQALLHADVSGRKEKLHTKLYVYSPQENPLVGKWRLQAVSACSGSKDISASPPNLLFRASDWRFGVDRQFWIGHAFGIAAGVQQSGTFVYDLKGATLNLKPSWPKGKSGSKWKVSFKDDGNTAELSAEKPQDGHGSLCVYTLKRPPAN